MFDPGAGDVSMLVPEKQGGGRWAHVASCDQKKLFRQKKLVMTKINRQNQEFMIIIQKVIHSMLQVAYHKTVYIYIYTIVYIL